MNELVTLGNLVSALCISYCLAIPKFIVQYLESVALIHYFYWHLYKRYNYLSSLNQKFIIT